MAMTSSNISSLAAACIELYLGHDESLVNRLQLSYSVYISFSLLACLFAAPPFLRKLRGHAQHNPAEVALSFRIPFLPSLTAFLFFAPLFLAVSNSFLLLTNVNNVRARPVPYNSQQQFETAYMASKMFTVFFALTPISSLFSSCARMLFMFRIVILCEKIGTTPLAPAPTSLRHTVLFVPILQAISHSILTRSLPIVTTTIPLPVPPCPL
jgi:hypothetical protein